MVGSKTFLENVTDRMTYTDLALFIDDVPTKFKFSARFLSAPTSCFYCSMYKESITFLRQIIGPIGVRALPLAAGIN